MSKTPTQTDRLAMCLFSALLDADRQTTNNPCVFFRYLQRGFEDYLRSEGFGEAADVAVELADAKVQFACFNINPSAIAPFAMDIARGISTAEPEPEIIPVEAGRG